MILQVHFPLTAEQLKRRLSLPARVSMQSYLDDVVVEANLYQIQENIPKAMSVDNAQFHTPRLPLERTFPPPPMPQFKTLYTQASGKTGITFPTPFTHALFASVGLRVSGSHDLGGIACKLMMLFVGMRYAYGMQEMRQSARAINV